MPSSRDNQSLIGARPARTYSAHILGRIIAGRRVSSTSVYLLFKFSLILRTVIESRVGTSVLRGFPTAWFAVPLSLPRMWSCALIVVHEIGHTWRDES